MSEYPEHEKMAKVTESSFEIGEFIEWMASKGRHFMVPGRDECPRCEGDGWDGDCGRCEGRPVGGVVTPDPDAAARAVSSPRSALSYCLVGERPYDQAATIIEKLASLGYEVAAIEADPDRKALEEHMRNVCDMAYTLFEDETTDTQERGEAHAALTFELESARALLAQLEDEDQ